MGRVFKKYPPYESRPFDEVLKFNSSFIIEIEYKENKTNSEKSLRNCNKYYKTFKINEYNDYKRYSTKNFSHIKITSKENQETSYYAEPKYDLVQYLTDLGSLVGLYVGISLIEMSILFIDFIDKIKIFVQFLSNLNFLIKIKVMLKLLFNKILQIIVFTKNMNWTLLAKIITLPVMLSQVIYLVNDYLLYSTLIRVEFIDFTTNTIDSNADENPLMNFEYSPTEFPAITICADNRFEEIYFDREYPSYYYKNMNIMKDIEFIIYSRLNNSINRKDVKYYKIYLESLQLILNCTMQIKSSISNTLVRNLIFSYLMTKEFHLLYSYYLPVLTPIYYWAMSNYFVEPFKEFFIGNNRDELNKNMKKYQDIHQFGIASLMKVEKFYGNRLNFKRLDSTSPWMSSLGMCRRYIYFENEKNRRAFYFQPDDLLSIPDFLSRTFYIHDPNEYPMKNVKGHQIDLIDKSIPIKLSKIKFTELEFPYSTMCKYYNANNQSDCLNRCYLQRYLDIFKCIPTNNYLHALFMYNQNYSSNEFCPMDLVITNQINKIIESECRLNCPSPCIHYHYQFEMGNPFVHKLMLLEKFDPYVSFEFASNFYQHIINYPKLTIMNLVINIANVINLWHGSSYFMLIVRMSNVLEKILLKIKNKLHCCKYLFDTRKYLVS